MFMTHERLSLEPYQTWQYCEVADIEPFQGQSDQIFQFSIISKIASESHSTFVRTERTGRKYDSLSPFPLQSQRTEKENVRVPPFPPVRCRSRLDESGKSTRENIKRCANENAKTGIFGSDFPSDARHLGPIWPPVWINVIQRDHASFRLSFFLFIYLSISRFLSRLFFSQLARFVPFSPRFCLLSFILLCLCTP